MIFSHNPKQHERQIKTELSSLRLESSVQTIAFVDLTGSTALKLQEGHRRAIKKILNAIVLAKAIVSEYNGSTVKELGDGILCRFDDPVKACLASLAIKAAGVKIAAQFTTAITLGMADLVIVNGNAVDVLGAAVDRCARISSFALPNQILVDRPLLEAVRTYLLEYANIIISDGRKRLLKGVGEAELFEISTADTKLHKYIRTSFRIHEEGRLPVADKIYFVRDAQSKVIELGTGLTAISKWFSGQRPAEFRDYIENLLARGVQVLFLLMDPKWRGAKQYLEDRGELEYIEDIKRSLRQLNQERERLLKLGLPGTLRIQLFRSFPSMHILCVDPADPVHGRMLASPYLYNLARSESPILELSRLSNPVLFSKYLSAVESLARDKSEPLD